MIAIDDRYFYIDTKKLFAFIMKEDSATRNDSQTIVQTYGYPRNQMGEFNTDEKFTMLSKEVSEGKQSMHDVNSNMKYDFMKMLISILVDVSQNDFGSSGELQSNFRLDDLTFGQRLAFNTLVDSGILIEKTM